MALSLTAQSTEGTVALLANQFEVDRLTPAEPIGQAVFTVDSSGEILVDVVSTNPNVVVTMEGPSGQLVSEATIAALGGRFGAFEVSGGGGGMLFLPILNTPGFHSSFFLPSLGPGSYTVHFDGGAGLTDEVAVVTQVFTNSQLRASLFATENEIVEGKPVALIAAVFDGTTPVTAANISVTVLPDTGDPVTVILADDGAQVDDAVGDGLYSGLFTPATVGEYGAAATISGTTTVGQSFVREAGTSFTVIAVTGDLLGTVQDSGVDADSNGSFESIALDVDVDAVTAGEFLLWVHLKKGTDPPLVGQARANLQIGQQAMIVSFTADDLRRLGDGPYEISLVELEFRTSEGFIPADRLIDVGQTDAYDLDTDFEPPALALAGPTTDMGVDDDTDETFDRLVITIPVEVQTPGGHLWRLTLTTDNLQVIDSLYGNTWLVAGTTSFQVEFDGARIRNFGADGPYRLRDFHLSRLEANLYADEIGVTQSYTAAQFDAPNPLLLSVEPGTASAGESVFVAITGADTTFTSGARTGCDRES